MTFCGKCGAQLQGDERFCVACGAEVTVQAASTAAPAAAPPTPAPSRPVAPVQPTGVPSPFAAHGPTPVVMGMPQPAPAKGGGMLWTVIVVAAILGGSYYYSQHNPPAPAQQQPGVPGQQPVPGQPGVPNQPGGYPEQQPGNPGQSGNNAALVRLQMFGGRWDAMNGFIQVSQARWTNRANVVVQSATLECIQFAANGAAIAQMQTTLHGPVQPQATSTYGPFQMGAISPYLANVKCGIVAVRPTGQ